MLRKITKWEQISIAILILIIHLLNLGVDEKIILKIIFKKWDGKHGGDKSGLG